MNKKQISIVHTLVIPVVIALLFFLLSSAAIKGKTNTTDEPSHLVRGIMLLKTGDYRLNQHHPILFNVLNAIPAVLNPKLKTESLESENWEQAKKDEMAVNLIQLNGGTNKFAEDILYLPRLSMIFIVSIFLIWFYKAIYQIFNFQIALISTLTLALSPTVIAHSALVTTDAPAMVTIFLGSWGLYKYIESGGKTVPLLTFILLSFLALITKYTAVFAAFIWIVILAHYEFFIAKKALKHGLTAISGTLLGWFLLLVFAYALQFMTLREVGYNNPWFDAATLDFISGIGKSIKFADIPQLLRDIYFNLKLPFPQYIRGFIDNVIKHDIYGHKTFLLGQFSYSGWWYYFPVVLAAKETISFVLLGISAVIYFPVRWVQLRLKNKLKYDPKIVFVVTPLFLFILSMFSSINLGVRHLLPIFPFLAIGIGVMCAELIKRSKTSIKLLYCLLGLSLLSLASQFPHYIEYYNELAGGPDRGYLIARDSNFDWGQNDGAVQRFVEEHKNASFSLTDLDKNGLWVVRVEDLFARPELKTEEMTKLYEEYTSGKIKPIAAINHTFWIFEVKDVQ